MSLLSLGWIPGAQLPVSIQIEFPFIPAGGTGGLAMETSAVAYAPNLVTSGDTRTFTWKGSDRVVPWRDVVRRVRM